MADMGHYSLWTVFNALELVITDQRRTHANSHMWVEGRNRVHSE